jgi:hypothetical protein
MPRPRLKRLFRLTTDPDPIQQRWTVRIWTNFKGNIHATEYRFWADAKTLDEAFELLHANGFACVRKTQGRVVPNGRFELRLSTGEL